MIRMMIILLIAAGLSCDAEGQGTKNGAASTRSAAESDARSGVAGTVVTDFMRYVSSGDKDKANALWEPLEHPASSASNLSPNEIQKLELKEGRLDWVNLFTEKQLQLGKILEEKGEGNRSTVTAELVTRESEKLWARALFHLRKTNDRWLISEIELADESRAR